MKRFLCALSLCLTVAVVAAQRPAITMTFHDGRVTIVAKDVSFRELLDEWSRVGGTSVVADPLPINRQSLALVDMLEFDAVQVLFGTFARVEVTDRASGAAGASRYASITLRPQTVAGSPAVPDRSLDVPAEAMFDYGSASGTGKAPVAPVLPPVDSSTTAAAPLPQGVDPESFFDYALPTGTPAALVQPPAASADQQGGAKAPQGLNRPTTIPELLYGYPRPTPPLPDGSVAPPNVGDPKAAPAGRGSEPAQDPASPAGSGKPGTSRGSGALNSGTHRTFGGGR